MLLPSDYFPIHSLPTFDELHDFDSYSMNNDDLNVPIFFILIFLNLKTFG